VNAVMNLWVSFSGRTLLYEVSFLPVQEILLQAACICCQELSICQSVRIRHLFYVPRKF